MLPSRLVKRIFLFTELGTGTKDGGSPMRNALARSDHEVTVRGFHGAWFDCPIAMPPDLVIIEPAPLRNLTAIAPALTSHPVLAAVPWLLVLDPERCHVAAQLPCHDFVLRDFRPEEALMRVERVLRQRPERESQLRSGQLTVDLRGHQARLRGVVLETTPQEFALLRHLVQHAGRAFSREALLDAVWGREYTGGPRTVDIHVRRLRVHLGHSAESLATVHGVGYKWMLQ